jgi:hypothetical protein
VAINRAAHPAEMRPMTSGERDADLSEGSTPLVGTSVDATGAVVVLSDAAVVLVVLVDVVVNVRVVLNVAVPVGGGRGTIVPLTFCCVPGKESRSIRDILDKQKKKNTNKSPSNSNNNNDSRVDFFKVAYGS